MTNPKIAIIGAGLAGLSAAKVLNEASIEVTLFESADSVGGRVRSKKRDGFILDEGFQVFNPAYPTARKLLNYKELGLRSFDAGVSVLLNDKDFVLANPLRSPDLIPKLLTTRIFLADMLRFGMYALSRPNVDELESDETAYQALSQAGMSESFIWQILNPFLQGVFLNNSLSSSKSFLDFVLRYFLLGKPTLPLYGMGGIPLSLAHSLTLTDIRLQTPVEKLEGNVLLTPERSETFDKIIVATDSKFLKQHFNLKTPDFHYVTTWYHTTDCARNSLSAGRGLLRVDSNSSRGPVINTVPLSHVSSTYSPRGKHLISSSTLSTDSSGEMEQLVRKHLSRLYAIDTTDWECIDVIHVPYALNTSSIPSIPHKLTDDMYLAGDWTYNTSIEGAMASGVRAAELLLNDIGKA
ncbi:MAG: NAD(P)/FAD-dependent oxidoreductase [Candidatus Nanopelagicales bacterium]